jgi:glycosylphosphatidylinositol transamidase
MHTTLAVSLRPSAAPLPLAVQRGAAALGNAAAALGIAGPAAAQRYAAEIQTVAAFSMQLAGGEPTGGHAAFLSHQIDAATLRLRLAAADPGGGTGAGAAAAGSVQARHQLQLAAYSTLAAAEMVLRTFNNLQERLHHSTALYVLVAADRFASIALYLAPPACLLAAALAQVSASARIACFSCCVFAPPAVCSVLCHPP